MVDSIKIKKTLEDKKDAELEFGYKLYQGGVVPGNTLRVVEIEDNDVEACCGTHCDSTSQVGWIKILNSKRIADGVVRIQLVAGDKVFEYLQNDQKILNDLMQLWGIPLQEINQTAFSFFQRYKKQKTLIKEQ